MRALVPCLALVGACTLGCGDLPGDVVGTYRVTMKLEENTCGPGAVNLLDGHRYAVELRSDDKYGYWRVPSQPPLRGTYDPPKFRFENSSLVASEGPDAGPRGCTLRQVDTLTGTVTKLPDAGGESPDSEESEGEDDELDAGAEDQDEDLDSGDGAESDDDAGVDDHSALRGQHVFIISALAGTDCTNAFAPRGSFEKLPCTVRYALSAVKIRPF